MGRIACGCGSRVGIGGGVQLRCKLKHLWAELGANGSQVGAKVFCEVVGGDGGRNSVWRGVEG